MLETLRDFVQREVLPAEAEVDRLISSLTGPSRFDSASLSAVARILDGLKARARGLGLWNLWLPHDARSHAHPCLLPSLSASVSPPLTTLEYAHAAEVCGWSGLAAVCVNSAAPDSGNMELLLRFGDARQQREWLTPLMEGVMTSSFAMTEPDVASSDARNISMRMSVVGDEVELVGRKAWITGAMNPTCGLLLVLALSDESHPPLRRHSIVLVPARAAGVKLLQPLAAFGFDDAPVGHALIDLDHVRVPTSHILGKRGDGFIMAQTRLGPGRIHHCMRAIGVGERALQLLLARASSRTVFGRTIDEHSTTQVDIAQCRIDLNTARLLVLHAAALVDASGGDIKRVRAAVAAIKVYVPNAVLRVIDAAIQVHGAAGVGMDTPLSRMWAGMRTLRIADGPDIVHLRTLGMSEIARARKMMEAAAAAAPRL